MTMTKDNISNILHNVEAEITAPAARDELALLTRRRDPGLGLSLSPKPHPRDYLEESRAQAEALRAEDRKNDIDPIIIGLLTHLPSSGEVWPEEKRKLWLSLIEGGFKLIYQEAKENG